jgi:hypothetical protein
VAFKEKTVTPDLAAWAFSSVVAVVDQIKPTRDTVPQGSSGALSLTIQTTLT